MDYEELLERAYQRLPNEVTSSERFEIPKVEAMQIGTQTIVKNFLQLSQTLRRDPKQILKFLSKELAVPATIDGQRAIFQTKLSIMIIQKKLENYVKAYIMCKECNRPDTKMIKEGRLSFMKCEACGAKYPVKSV